MADNNKTSDTNKDVNKGATTSIESNTGTSKERPAPQFKDTNTTPKISKQTEVENKYFTTLYDFRQARLEEDRTKLWEKVKAIIHDNPVEIYNMTKGEKITKGYKDTPIEDIARDALEKVEFGLQNTGAISVRADEWFKGFNNALQQRITPTDNSWYDGTLNVMSLERVKPSVDNPYTYVQKIFKDFALPSGEYWREIYSGRTVVGEYDGKEGVFKEFLPEASKDPTDKTGGGTIVPKGFYDYTYNYSFKNEVTLVHPLAKGMALKTGDYIATSSLDMIGFRLSTNINVARLALAYLQSQVQNRETIQLTGSQKIEDVTTSLIGNDVTMDYNTATEILIQIEKLLKTWKEYAANTFKIGYKGGIVSDGNPATWLKIDPTKFTAYLPVPLWVEIERKQQYQLTAPQIKGIWEKINHVGINIDSSSPIEGIGWLDSGNFPSGSKPMRKMENKTIYLLADGSGIHTVQFSTPTSTMWKNNVQVVFYQVKGGFNFWVQNIGMAIDIVNPTTKVDGTPAIQTQPKYKYSEYYLPNNDDTVALSPSQHFALEELALKDQALPNASDIKEYLIHIAPRHSKALIENSKLFKSLKRGEKAYVTKYLQITEPKRINHLKLGGSPCFL